MALTEEKKGEYIKLFEKGLSHKELGYKFSMSEAASRALAFKLRKKSFIKTVRGFKPENLVKKEDIKDIKNIEDVEEKKLLEMLEKNPKTIGELSRILDRSKETVFKRLESLRKRGFDIEVKKDSKLATMEKTPKKVIKPIKINSLVKNEIKIGIISDTHLTSIHQQITLLHTAYKIGEKEKIDLMLHAGDVTDGFHHYKVPEYTSFTKSVDEIEDYVVKNYPKTNKFKTKLIGGRHDLSTKVDFGHNMLRLICEKRDDLSYIGDTMATFQVKSIKIRLHHPTGGLAYSKSYRPQKVTEGMIGNFLQNLRSVNDIDSLPQIIIFGHFHQAFFFPYLGSLIFGVPALQSQTPYLEGKGLYPDIGMWVLKIFFDSRGNVLEIIPKLKLWTHLIKERDF